MDSNVPSALEAQGLLSRGALRALKFANIVKLQMTSDSFACCAPWFNPGPLVLNVSDPLGLSLPELASLHTLRVRYTSLDKKICSLQGFIQSSSVHQARHSQ